MISFCIFSQHMYADTYPSLRITGSTSCNNRHACPIQTRGHEAISKDGYARSAFN